jgi:hypothetical protein
VTAKHKKKTARRRSYLLRTSGQYLNCGIAINSSFVALYIPSEIEGPMRLKRPPTKTEGQHGSLCFFYLMFSCAQNLLNAATVFRGENVSSKYPIDRETKLMERPGILAVDYHSAASLAR